MLIYIYKSAIIVLATVSEQEQQRDQQEQQPHQNITEESILEVLYLLICLLLINEC